MSMGTYGMVLPWAVSIRKTLECKTAISIQEDYALHVVSFVPTGVL